MKYQDTTITITREEEIKIESIKDLLGSCRIQHRR